MSVRIPYHASISTDGFAFTSQMSLSSPALCRALHQTVLTSTLQFGIFCCSQLVDARIYSARHPLSIGAGQAGTPE